MEKVENWEWEVESWKKVFLLIYSPLKAFCPCPNAQRHSLKQAKAWLAKASSYQVFGKQPPTIFHPDV